MNSGTTVDAMDTVVGSEFSFEEMESVVPPSFTGLFDLLVAFGDGFFKLEMQVVINGGCERRRFTERDEEMDLKIVDLRVESKVAEMWNWEKGGCISHAFTVILTTMQAQTPRSQAVPYNPQSRFALVVNGTIIVKKRFQIRETCISIFDIATSLL
ncbi:hypothetical protein E3N88_17232 [Mikania micrantha]|uniref:Uncharacterized protein n=1 Tax=Mikania micrantha TaxID=192012 RepID=A0A5N6NRA0_9ASTR|nr:hypothetical protein E3N88_17232 [Mikania micrantha]